ncbi:MAG TPA: hypothetical protein VEC11_12700 [Allosphingosinicella sp.]|nr:hypothetical protein [Allosphingosinicella sp.]
MAEYAVLVAINRAALDEVAERRGCTIVEDSVCEFDGLVTYKDATLAQAGSVTVGQGGIAALASLD